MLPVYRGVKHQYSYGLGSIFKTALKTVTPLIKPLVKYGLNAVKKKESNKEYVQRKISSYVVKIKKVVISRGKQSIRDFAQKLKTVTGINKRKSRKNPHSSFRSHSGKIITKRKNTDDREFLIHLIKNIIKKNDAKRFM